MKKIIAFSFLLISVGAFAQNDVLKDTIVKPVITEPGKPDGEKAMLQIGEEGGRLKSSDGKVELVFPAGALTENTNIIIQPVTNLAPNGSGKAYWFEPSGIQFKKPVQIIINYTDEEAEICPPDLMGLAIQNKQGQWSFINYDSWDSTARSLKGSITHFSRAANVNKMMLIPKAMNIMVRTKHQLTISDISTSFGYDEEDNETYLYAMLDKNKSVLWYVNDVEGGNYRDGTIRPEAKVFGDYSAPSTVPAKNPVTVKVELYLMKKSRGGKTLNLLKTFKSKIHIAGYVYEVNMESIIKGGNKYVWGGIQTIIDFGSFYVSLEKNLPAVKNIINNLEVSKNDCAVIKHLNPATCTGYLHVASIKDIKVTPANPGQPDPIVEIWFVPYPVEFSAFEFDCPPPPGSRGRSTGTIPVTRIGRAFPDYIKFIAKDEKQTIIEKESEDTYLKVWVQKLIDLK